MSGNIKDDAAERHARSILENSKLCRVPLDQATELITIDLAAITQLIRSTWTEATEAAAKKCDEEKVDADDTKQAEDYAYNSACDHCAAAIRGKA